MKKILALDQSTSKTGYAIFENVELKNVELQRYGIIRPSKKINSNNLISMFFNVIQKIEEVKPDLICIEDVYMKRGKTFNIQTHKTLSNLQGMLISYFLLKNIEYVVIHPSKWKNKIVGKKQITKEQTQSFLKEKYDINFKEDEADAICIGLYCVSNL